MHMVEELKALKELLDMGAITQEEFDAKKTELLSKPMTELAPAKEAEPVADPRSQGEKSKLVAGLLALFLGGLGVHKFYLGYTQEGVIMLLGSTLGCLLLFLGPVAMGVISLIEGITYLTKTDEQFEATYVQGHKGWF